MMTIVPPRKRPISAPMKKPVVTVPVIDMVVGKPVRHLAILPSSKEPSNRERLMGPTDLSGKRFERKRSLSYACMCHP